MKTLDQIVAWSRAWLDAVGPDGIARYFGSSGAEWEDWGKLEWKNLQGRVADVKQAYKELAASPAHCAVNVLAVRGPDEQSHLFCARSLMFGQAAAVYGFLRFSRAISALGTALLSPVLIEFFDDFPQVEPQASAASAQEAMENLIDLLGWELSTSDEKRKPFKETFVELGVQVDYSKVREDRILLSNKPGRVEAIEAQVKEVKDRPDKVFTVKNALS